jgi:hypothetical protein
VFINDILVCIGFISTSATPNSCSVRSSSSASQYKSSQVRRARPRSLRPTFALPCAYAESINPVLTIVIVRNVANHIPKTLYFILRMLSICRHRHFAKIYKTFGVTKFYRINLFMLHILYKLSL